MSNSTNQKYMRAPQIRILNKSNLTENTQWRKKHKYKTYIKATKDSKSVTEIAAIFVPFTLSFNLANV